MSILRELLEKTIQLGASDLHATCGQSPVYRVSGDIVIEDTDPLDEKDINSMIDDSLPDHLKGQFKTNGEIDYSTSEDGVGRFRVNAFLTRRGPALAFRHVKSEIPSFQDLNLPDTLTSLVNTKRGILFVTGSTGSGKSSTLAALIRRINETQNRRIITLEDPVEYIFSDVNSIISQREIGLDTKTFHDGLKRVLRQDPDIIMVGEMRDAESFSAALSAAETGHLVMSTLHTSTAAQSIARILDFTPQSERDQIRKALSENLAAILAQRLIPSIQSSVVPAVEIMFNTPTVRKLIYTDQLSKLPHAIESDNESGMQSFDQAIYNLIVNGKITEDTGLSHASNPQSLQMRLKGILHDSGGIM